MSFGTFKEGYISGRTGEQDPFGDDFAGELVMVAIELVTVSLVSLNKGVSEPVTRREPVTKNEILFSDGFANSLNRGVSEPVTRSKAVTRNHKKNNNLTKKYMTQTFKLKKGEISFGQEKIIISDKAKTQKYMTLFSSGIWIVLGILNALKIDESGDKFLHSLWIVLGVLNLLIMIVTLSRSTMSVIPLDEVKSIKVKQRFSNTTLDIKLRNNQLRRVLQVEDTEGLEKYIEVYFEIS